MVLLVRRIFCLLPGVDALLRIIHDYTATVGSTSRKSHRQKVLSARFQQIFEVMPAHGEAFQRGLISCERLVEVLVPPFLKLAGKANLEQQSREQPADGQPTGTADKYMFRWSAELHEIVSGNTSQGIFQIQQVLSPKKRKELVKAVLAAKFPEVQIGIIWFDVFCPK